VSNSSAEAGYLRKAVIRVPFFVYRKLLSPVLHAASGSAGACRFQPTCSEYAALAVEHHGILRGTLMAVRRIAKCHPFHPAEFDPVPGVWSPSPSLQSSPSPVTIEEAALAPAVASRPLGGTLPYDHR